MKVLAVDKHEPAADGAVADDHAVAGDFLLSHAEVGAAMFLEHVPLFEAAFVEQQLKPLAGGQLAFLVLLFDACLAAAQFGRSAFFFQ